MDGATSGVDIVTAQRVRRYREQIYAGVDHAPPYTLHPTTYTLHHTPYTQHPSRHGHLVFMPPACAA